MSFEAVVVELIQTENLPDAHREGSAFLLLLLRQAALVIALCCSSGFLERYSLLPRFRAVCIIIPARFVRASEDRISLA